MSSLEDTLALLCRAGSLWIEHWSVIICLQAFKAVYVPPTSFTYSNMPLVNHSAVRLGFKHGLLLSGGDSFDATVASLTLLQKLGFWDSMTPRWRRSLLSKTCPLIHHVFLLLPGTQSTPFWSMTVTAGCPLRRRRHLQRRSGVPDMHCNHCGHVFGYAAVASFSGVIYKLSEQPPMFYPDLSQISRRKSP